MRKMGIDFGTKKVGLAVSDESGKMAFPHSVIPNDDKLLETVTSLIEAKQVKEIVIGHSLNSEGNDNPVHKAAVEFVGDLTLRLPIPVYFEPEQYSTKQAQQMQGKNEHTDASAAAIILESYLKKQNTTSIFDELND